MNEPRRVVVGVHPVRELLRSGAAVDHVLVDEDRRRSDAVRELIALARDAGVSVNEVPRSRIDEQAEGLVHQGVLAQAPPFTYLDLDELLARVAAADEPAFLVALDGVTDPHNLGSVARTAEAVGAHGLLVPGRRAAGVTPTVEKAAAGALAHLPVARVGNLGNALRSLESAGVWRVGLDADAETPIEDCQLFTEPFVLVVGSEGRGLARTSQLHCDLLVRLVTAGRVGSLNASVAAAIAVYLARQRRGVHAT